MENNHDNHAEDVHKVLPHTAVLIQAAAVLIRDCERISAKLPLSTQKKLSKLQRLNEERINVLLIGGSPVITTGEANGLATDDKPQSKAEDRKARRKLRRRMKK